MRGHRRVRVRPRILVAPVIAAGGRGRPRRADRRSAGRPSPGPPGPGVRTGVFTDGGWTLSYVADVQISGPFPGGSTGTGAGAVTGTGVFEVNGGGVSGTHTGAGTASSSITVPGGQTGPAILNLALEGPVAGTTDRTVLQGDVRASGSVSVSTAGLATTVPVDFDGALGDGAGRAAVDVLGRVRPGHRQLDRRPPRRRAGARPACRSRDRPRSSRSAAGSPADSAPAYTRQVTQLLADVDGFVERVGTAPLDVTGLDAVVARAELLSSSLPVVDDCSRTDRTSGYSTFLGVEVARLLTAARTQLPRVSTPGSRPPRRSRLPHRGDRDRRARGPARRRSNTRCATSSTAVRARR